MLLFIKPCKIKLCGYLKRCDVTCFSAGCCYYDFKVLYRECRCTEKCQFRDTTRQDGNIGNVIKSERHLQKEIKAGSRYTLSTNLLVFRVSKQSKFAGPCG